MTLLNSLRPMAGKAYVARLATSRFISDSVLLQEIASVLDNTRFEVIHFNHGKHGWQHGEKEYDEAFPKLLATIRAHAANAKLIWASTTTLKTSKVLPSGDQSHSSDERHQRRNTRQHHHDAESRTEICARVDHDIWRDTLVFPEHNFGPGRTGSQPEQDEVVGVVNEKENFTIQAGWNIDKLMRRSMSQLANQIKTAGHNLIVFNPLNWKRSALLRYQLDAGTTLTDVATGRPVECEIVAEKEGAQTMRFPAADAPPLGYKVFRLGHGKMQRTASAEHTPRIETEILLPDDAKEIQLNNRIQVDLLYAKQAAYFLFPWAMSRPTFRYDIPHGFVNPATDLLEGGCSDWF